MGRHSSLPVRPQESLAERSEAATDQGVENTEQRSFNCKNGCISASSKNALNPKPQTLNPEP